MKLDTSKLEWTRAPKEYTVGEDTVTINTQPHTDLWQRTYYHFRNDNAPALQLTTQEQFFSFTVEVSFAYNHRFDQCGIVMYLDSENWLKASIEYQDEDIQHLGSVVTNGGYSDWSTAQISSKITRVWYRLSRREDDYRVEWSEDGENFRQMRICHMHKGGGQIRFGIYACSPEESSFQARFSNMELTECMWPDHDGQAPDPE